MSNTVIDDGDGRPGSWRTTSGMVAICVLTILTLSGGRLGVGLAAATPGDRQVVTEPTSPERVVDLSGDAIPEISKPDAKLDSAVAELMDVHRESGRRAARRHARRHGLRMREDRVFLRVDAGLPAREIPLRQASDPELVGQVRDHLEEVGARVRRAYGPHLEAAIPVGVLQELLDDPRIRGLRRPWRAQAEQVISEGVEVIGADRWRDTTFRQPEGGLKVGVIDLGFMNYQDLLGEELPVRSKVETRSFLDSDDIEADTVHGAGVAEIIFDIVPEASFFLTNIETLGDLNEAVDFLLQQGVHVINMSLGFFGAGPGTGTGPAVEIVQRAPAAGVPFVTSAGNQADRHWIGPFLDDDGDGRHEFTPGGDEDNSFRRDAGAPIDIFMTWDFDDWSSSSQDFDLFVIDSTGRVVGASTNSQAGGAGEFATEVIQIRAPRTDVYGIVITRFDADPDETLEIHTFFSGLQHVVAGQSLTLPADARDVVAVGATLFTDDRLEFFSSRGPTNDGRIKPDFAGPDRVSTVSFGTTGFAGTSSSSPHMTGAIALLIGRLGLVSGMQAVEMLEPRAVDLGPAGKDVRFGHGRLSVVPPR